MRSLAALSAGAIFGFGLALGGMLDPSVVRGFLDFAGAFDPRLGFVFAGALAVSSIGYAVSHRMRQPLAATRFHIPGVKSIDVSLIAGAALFGLGWGMVGLCPGPAIAGLALRIPATASFVAAMLAGMLAFEVLRPGRKKSVLPQT
jgi:uncharacterized membrane protein YedE/YeeE